MECDQISSFMVHFPSELAGCVISNTATPVAEFNRAVRAVRLFTARAADLARLLLSFRPRDGACRARFQNALPFKLPTNRTAYERAHRKMLSGAECREARDQIWLHRIRLQRPFTLRRRRHDGFDDDMTVSCQSTARRRAARLG